MKVVVITEQLRRKVPGGIGTYVSGLVRGLQSTDVDVATYTSLLPAPLLSRAWDRGLPPRPPQGDVVHATSLLTPGRTNPLTVMVHDLAWRDIPEAYPPHGRRWHEQALGRAIERAAVLITPSQATADDLIAAGADGARVEVVEEGSDHLPPPDQAAAANRLAAHGVTGPYLLTVSTLEPRKNLTRLLAAYSKARPRLPEPWPLVVVGPTGWGEAVEPVPGAVLLGQVPGPVLAALYADAASMAYVPLKEGFGLPAVEAMAAGAPVVASPMPSVGDAALVVDPLDEAAIADALVDAATDQATRTNLIAAGRQRAGQLTWAAAARRHVEIWSRLAR